MKKAHAGLYQTTYAATYILLHCMNETKTMQDENAWIPTAKFGDENAINVYAYAYIKKHNCMLWNAYTIHCSYCSCVCVLYDAFDVGILMLLMLAFDAWFFTFYKKN